MPDLNKFAGTKSFWREYESLSEDKRSAADAVFIKFKRDPFDDSLGTHKITRLSALYKETVWSVPIMKDLRVLFVMRDNLVLSVSIGSHAIYK